MAEVQLNGVTKTYPGGVHAVRPTSLHLNDGEFTVLVGPSGCGKSTLLRMIAGLETITDGTVSIGGRVVNGVAARDRDVSMVFQNYALYPHMTVRRNMSFGLLQRRMHGGMLNALYRRAKWRAELDAIDAKVNDTARMLDIVPLLDRLPRALSGGQRQRVALGRALVRSPKVFLFDEPLSNLDARLRIDMRAELRALHRRLRATMIYVTHDQEEAMTLADRMVVMRDGVVQQFGTPTECYAQPSNRFVASFVGVPVMNFIEGHVHGTEFRASGMNISVPAGKWNAPAGASAVLGIRPDQIHVVSGANPPAAGTAAALPAQLEAVESLGDRADLVLTVAGRRMVARTAAFQELREGTAVGVVLDTTHAHLFQPGESGARFA